jgi:hypothetical protein
VPYPVFAETQIPELAPRENAILAIGEDTDSALGATNGTFAANRAVTVAFVRTRGG